MLSPGSVWLQQRHYKGTSRTLVTMNFGCGYVGTVQKVKQTQTISDTQGLHAGTAAQHFNTCLIHHQVYGSVYTQYAC